MFRLLTYLFHYMEYSVGISFAIIAKHAQPTALQN